MSSEPSRRLLPYAKLVNAVLRRIAREKDSNTPDLPPLADLPDWLAQRWVAHYGQETAEKIALRHFVGEAA